MTCLGWGTLVCEKCLHGASILNLLLLLGSNLLDFFLLFNLLYDSSWSKLVILSERIRFSWRGNHLYIWPFIHWNLHTLLDYLKLIQLTQRPVELLFRFASTLHCTFWVFMTLLVWLIGSMNWSFWTFWSLWYCIVSSLLQCGLAHRHSVSCSLSLRLRILF